MNTPDPQAEADFADTIGSLAVSTQKIYCSGLLRDFNSYGSDTATEAGDTDSEMETLNEPVMNCLKMLELRNKVRNDTAGNNIPPPSLQEKHLW